MPKKPRAPKTWHDTTKRAIDAMAPKETAWDAYFRAPKGFHVRIHPDGRKTFALRYKADATYIRHTIGAYGDWTLDRAQKEASRLRANVDDPMTLSPHEEKAAHRAQVTVATLTTDLVAEMGRTLSATYVKSIKTYLEALPASVRKTLVPKVTVDQCRAVLAAFHETPATHNLVRNALSKLFGFAMAREIIARNPVAPVKRLSEPPREPNPLDDAQCFALGEALRAYEAEGRPWQAVAAIRLLYHSACRVSEILKLEWSEIEWDVSELHLLKSKTKGERRRDKRVVGEPVLVLLREIRALHDRRGIDSPYVLPSPENPAKPYTALDPHWHRIRKAAGVPTMHLHDFRHDVLSDYGADYSAAIGQAVSGHATKQHLDRYQKAQKNPIVKQAADTIGARRQSALDTAPSALKLVG